MTPLMQQYWQIKNQHQDKILLFRMGDFFEMFHQDAETAAPILGIALTVRNKKSGDDTKMCGVPYHSIAGPISKLLSSGFKVAICDQIEDPALAKGLVKRAVTRILSPGMVYDPATLDQLQGHFLCAFDSLYMSFLEPTTGESFYYRWGGIEGSKQRLLSLMNPSEIILTSSQRRDWDENTYSATRLSTHLTVVESCEGDQRPSDLPESAFRLQKYATQMQGGDIEYTIKSWQARELNICLELNAMTVRHLELFQTFKGEKRGSLFYAIDRTKTSAGARLLKSWMQFPLSRYDLIEERLDRVNYWKESVGALKSVRQILASMGDLERRLGKIASPTCQARDLIAVAQSLQIGLTVTPYCKQEEFDQNLLNMADELRIQIQKIIVDEPPLSVRQGGMIQKGVHPQLDEWMDLTEHSEQKLLELEERERQATGISSLKVKYNQVFGYYIEVTHTHIQKVPSHYQRKQTLANAERYTTEELAKLETQLLAAQTQRSDLEYQIFLELKQTLLKATADLLLLARRWAELDVLTSLAWLAIECEYTRPLFHAQHLKLKASRHPVVEQELSHSFVPNDIQLLRGDCLLLTGPNMAGKSTIMRQVAITVIMAQLGSFVPAAHAELPIFQRLYTRIGASDFLSEGLSTFMVEMKEAAEILSSADPHSLVILDEIGRGTSTYDGLSLAQAILEHLVSVRRPMTLFATHYHELTALSLRFPQIHNGHMAIYEKSGAIQFLHTLKHGPANKSYGIQVGKLAGLPSSVTQRAKVLLQALESGNDGDDRQLALELDPIPSQDSTAEVTVDPLWIDLIDQIKLTPVQQMTPLEALNKIAQWQQKLS